MLVRGHGLVETLHCPLVGDLADGGDGGGRWGPGDDGDGVGEGMGAVVVP